MRDAAPSEADRVETFDEGLPAPVRAAVARFMQTMCDARRSITLAESCTGGLIAAAFTDVEGCSHAFDRGFVVYSEEAKTECLGVEPEILREHGAVSEACARAMARGGLAFSRADPALAVTGFAGPGAPGEEPGLVHFAAARRGGAALALERHYGARPRAEVRIACLADGVALLGRLL